MNTGERMKQLRKQRDISADYVAEKLGVDRSTVFRYEKGDIEKLPTDILIPLAKVLQTTPSYLMGWTDDPDPDSNIETNLDTEPSSSKVVPIASVQSKQLTPDELEILNIYSDLDDSGKTQAKGYLTFLHQSHSISKSNGVYGITAAYGGEKTVTHTTEEERNIIAEMIFKKNQEEKNK